MIDNGLVCHGLWGWWLFLRSECSGSEYTSRQPHLVKRSQSLRLNWLVVRAVVPRIHTTLQWRTHQGIGVQGERICTTVTLVRLVSFAEQCKVAYRRVLNLQHNVEHSKVEHNVFWYYDKIKGSKMSCWNSLHCSHVLEKAQLNSMVQLSSQLVHELLKEGLPRHTMLYKMGLWHLSEFAMYCWLPLFTALISRS